MKRDFVPFVLTALACSSALSDDVVIRGLHYTGVQILNVQDEQIVFRTSAGSEVRKPVADVTSMVLVGKDLFNRGEELLTIGDFAEAAKAYDSAASKMPEGWQKELVKHRLAVLAKRQEEARNVATRPSSATMPSVPIEPMPLPTRPAASTRPTSPATQPTSESATQPAQSADPTTEPATTQAAETRPEATTQQAPAPITGPVSPEAMVDILQAVPTNPKDKPQIWEKLTTLEKERAEKRYAADLEAWKKKSEFHGRRVSWALRLDKFSPTEDLSGYMLTGNSESGYLVTVSLSLAAGDGLRKLKKGDPIRVIGTIQEYHIDGAGRDDSIFRVKTAVSFGALLKDATVEPDKPRPAQPPVAPKDTKPIRVKPAQ